MPRKAFVADLQEAIGSTVSSRISELQTGDEDGSFMFTYTILGVDAQQVTIQVLVPGKCCCYRNFRDLLPCWCLGDGDNQANSKQTFLNTLPIMNV